MPAGRQYAFVTVTTVPETDGVALSFAQQSRPDVVPEEFGGYRVVRVVTRTAIATTVIVRSVDDTRVARVFSESCPPHTIDAEVAVLDAIARSGSALRDHVVVLHELVTVPDGRLALIFDLARGPSLEDVLALRRGTLSIGEAVTILAPLAEALEAAHAVGLTGISFEPSTVRFTTSGAPILVGVAEATAGPALPDRFRALEPEYSHDRTCFEQLAAAITAAVTAADQSALMAALSAPHRGFSIAATLFDLAEPVPVVLDPVSPVVSISVSEQQSTSPQTSQVSAPAPHEAPATPTDQTPPRWLAVTLETMSALGVPVAIRTTVETTARAVNARVAMGLEKTSQRVRNKGAARPRFVLVGAAGLGALIVALVIVVAPGSSREPVIANTSGDAGVDEAPLIDGSDIDTGVVREEPVDADARSTLHRESPELLADPTADQWTVLTTELVTRWVTCHATISTASDEAEFDCRADVAHRGSAAEDLLGRGDSRHAILERWLTVRGESVVRERMGGAAVIDLVLSDDSASRPDSAAQTATASLLVVRSEAGWRIRSVLSDEQSD